MNLAWAEGNLQIYHVQAQALMTVSYTHLADKVYIEPLNAQTLKKVILKEKPDSILPTLGGQNGLNLAMELYEEGFLDEQNVKMIGTVASAIKMAEDRQDFKDTMARIGEPCAESLVVHTCLLYTSRCV